VTGLDELLSGGRGVVRQVPDVPDVSKLRRSADPARLATVTLAAIDGGLVLTQTRRDRGQLRIALDAAHASLPTFALEGGARGRA
jgi:TetR/AcrR family transcriptional regulator, transcriptional repressor for nem operon